MTASGEVTELLQRFARGDKKAEADLLLHVYRELRAIAKRHLRAERQGHTLQPTALVHEAYVRLVGKTDIEWQNRSHFFSVASQTMRRILVDYARERKAEKRGGGRHGIALEDALSVSPEHCDLVEDLDAALERLEKVSPRQAKVVELRFFGGLNEEEIAAIVEVSVRTVKRDWRVARAWLYEELSK